MESSFSLDGLHLRRWPLKPEQRARGTVQIVHGLGEHIGRYDALAQRLNEAGWLVIGHDQRGHGRSEGARGRLPHSHSLLADLGAVMDNARGSGPLVLLGHSMGGAVAARFVAESGARLPARWSRDVHGLVLSSPALSPRVSLLQRLALGLLPRLLPHRQMSNGLDAAWLSHDPAVVAAYRSDRLNHDRITPRLARFIVQAGRQALAAAPTWPVPTLLMWGEDDRCVDPAGSRSFAAAAPAALVQAVPWPGLAHEILNEREPEREQVLQQLLGWLDTIDSRAAQHQARPLPRREILSASPTTRSA